VTALINDTLPFRDGRPGGRQLVGDVRALRERCDFPSRSISEATSPSSSRWFATVTRGPPGLDGEAHDRSVDASVAQGPCDRAPPVPAVMVSDGPRPLHERETFRQPRFLLAKIVLAPVAVGQVSNPLPPHRARQQTRGHRGVDDDAHPLAPGHGEKSVLSGSVEEGDRQPERLHGRGSLDPPEMVHAEVGDADVLDESLPLSLTKVDQLSSRRSGEGPWT
jgi:hypothetical protein